MIETLKIRGGKQLIGTVNPISNKNSILPALIASMLTDKKMFYTDVPDTTDVDIVLQILEKLGAKVIRDGGKVEISCDNLSYSNIDYELGIRLRATILFIGPLLARFGKASVPIPGGCELGKRSISAHIDGFIKMGAEITYSNDYIYFSLDKKIITNIDIWMNEASVTATENLAMFASNCDVKITLYDSAAEPHVVDLLNLLQDMGAELSGTGSNYIEINGNNNLGGAVFTPRPDFVDISGYIVAAAITKGEITIKNANHNNIMGGIIQLLRKFNINIIQDGEDLIVKGDNPLEIDLVNSGFPLAENSLPKLYPRPWPGFPVDVLPVIVTLASKTKGKLLINNWMYENGLDFAKEMNSIGADIFIVSPDKVIVNGPVNFTGGEIEPPKVIQSCKAIFLAALCDNVETTIHGTEILKRRYPNIYSIYKSLGADIELVS